MELFIKVQPVEKDENDNTIDYMKEFERQKLMAKVQANPYKAVLAWFLEKFKDYSTYKEFFKKLEEEEKSKKEQEENEKYSEFVA